MLSLLYSLVYGLADQHPAALVGGTVLFCCALLVTYKVTRALLDPLRSVPGPFFARFTRLWLFRQYQTYGWEKTNVALHRKYGPVVRIAPGQYSIDDAEGTRTLYGHGSHFTKSSWYEPFGNPGFTNLFNERDPSHHGPMRKKYASAYSMSALVSYEPYIDECNAIFKERLDDAARAKGAVDMQRYTQCYAFDVVGMITFSHRLGFLDRCEDEIGLIRDIHAGNTWNPLAGLYSSLNARLQMFVPNSAAASLRFVVPKVTRQMELARRDGEVKDATAPMDFTQKLVKANQDHPEKMDVTDILRGATTNVAAGSDTTGIALSAVVYFLARTPRVLEALRDELDAAERSGAMSTPIRFHEAQKLPYLQAVIKEALRVHPSVGQTFPRVVPKQGATICGRHFPAGSVVGVNPYVTHRNTDLWGADADVFRPERWIEGKVPAEIHFMTFGQGSRTCIGKNISAMEMSKLVPEMVRDYDFTMASPDREWTCQTRFFVKPVDFYCYVSKRKA